MTRKSDQIVIPLGGEFYLAPVGTALPTSVAVAKTAAATTPWKGMGWASEEGVTVSQERNQIEIPAWGSNGLPVKKKTTGRVFSFGGTLLQSNAMNVKTWFGSTDFASDGATGDTTPGYRADIEVAAPSSEFALLCLWTVDQYDFGLTFGRVDLMSDGELTIVDTDAQQYALTMSSMVPDSGSLVGRILTNHPGFAPA